MRHLTLEALARLVDEAPDAREAGHLETCGPCREELEALRAQTAALATLPELMPGPDRWATIRERLREKDVIRQPTATPRPLAPGVVRVAAAVALFLGGGAAGFLVRGAAPPEPALAASGEVEAPVPDAAGGPELATGGTAGGEAEGDVQLTDEMFAAALDRFMQASGTSAPDPAARLAALDNIVLTTAEALNESPGDPVINSYHLTAVAQRNQLLRQLSVSAGEPVF